MASPSSAGALPLRSGRGALGQTGVGLLVAAVATALTAYATSSATLKAVEAVLVVGGSLWFATTSRPQLALALLMLYLGLLDGYLKLATGSNLVTFLRDALLFSLAAGVLVRAIVQGKRLAAPPLSGWVLGFVVLALVQVFNPQDGSLYHSLAGLRQNLEFVPLFFLTFAFVRTKKALRVFVILLLVIAAANGVTSYIQFHESPATFAAWGPGYAQRILGGGNFEAAGRSFYTTTGNHTRPFGLGSDSGDGGVVGAFAFGGVLALASLFTRRRYLVFAVAMAIGATVAVVTSQGRGALVASLVVALGYGLLVARSRDRLSTILGLALAGAVSFVVVQAIVSSAGSSQFRYQGLTASGIVQTTNTARGKSFAAIPKNLVNYPLGGGLGVGGPAAGVGGAPPLAGAVDTETEISFATLETGIAGMLVLIGFTVTVFVLGLRRCRHEPDPEARRLLAAIIAPVAGMLALYLVSAITPTTPSGPYLWAAGGVVSYWLITRQATLKRGDVLPIGSA